MNRLLSTCFGNRSYGSTSATHIRAQRSAFSFFSQFTAKIFFYLGLASALAACDAKFKSAQLGPGTGGGGSATSTAAFVGLSISDGAIYDYGNVASGGGSANHTFTVTNNSADVGTLGTVTTVGLGLAAQYTLTGGTCTTGAAIAPAGTCTLIVTYTPTGLATNISGISLGYTLNALPYTATRPIMGTGSLPASLTISDAATYNYGNVTVGASGSHTFTVTNGGGSAAVLGTVSNAGLGIAAQYSVNTGTSTCATGGSLAAGASCTLIVTYSPNAAATHNSTITLAYNDGTGAQNATRAITGTGIGAAVLTISDAGFDYGLIAIGGGSYAKTFTVSNGAGLATATLGSTLSTTAIGLNGTKYAYTAGGTCTASGTLAASASCTLIVTFTPTALGVENGTISLSYNDGAATQSATRAITGTGANVALLSLSDSDPYDYGNVASGGSATHSFTLSNAAGRASATLGTITSAALGLSAAYSVTGASTCATGGTVAAAGSCTIVVSFNPSSAAVFNSSLTVSYNNGVSAQTVARTVTGTGVIAGYLTISDATTYDFGTLANTVTVTHAFTITNTGGANATIGAAAINDAALGLSAPLTMSAHTCNDSAVLAPLATCTITVQYHPTSTGATSQTLSVGYNDGLGATSSTRPITATSANVAVLTVSDAATYDYGTVAFGGATASHTFTVSNGVGLATATLGSVNTTTNIGLNGTKYTRTGGTCADSGTIAGGASCTIIVTYTPTAAAVDTGTISVSYNDGLAGQTATRPITGTGANAAVLTISDAATYDYGNVAIGGGSAVHTFTVSNGAGRATATLSTVNTTANLGLTGTKYTRTGGTCADSGTLAASASCTIIVTYTPTALGVNTGTISVGYNDGNTTQTSTRDVTGTGANVALLTISDATTYDYGTVAIGGGTAVHTFTVSNGAGLAPATLSSVNTTANLGLTGTKYTRTGGTCADSGTLAASGSCTIQVTFTPTATGAATGTITVNYNNGVSATSSSRDVTGTGANAALLTISDGVTYDYGSVAIGGGTAVHTFTVSNGAGRATATLSTVNTTANLGLGATKYTRTGGTCADSGTLAASASCTIQVTFTPTATGAATGTITVNYDDGTGATSTTRDVTGTGVNPALLTISDGATYDYGTVAIGSTGVHTFTVSNGAARATATLSTVNTTANLGLNATKYTRTGGTCADSGTIAAGASCTIQVTFTPTATGAATATITVNYNDGASSTSSTRDLTGTGANPALLTISDGATYDFGTVAIGGGTAVHSFTVTNGAGRYTATLSTVNTTANLGLTGTKYTRTGGTCADSGTLAGGASCTIQITFTPTATGAATGTITVNYNDGTGSTSSTRDLTGTGANPALLTISDSTTYDYGTVAVGSSGAHTFTVSNGASRATATLSSVNTTANLGLTGTKYTRTGGTCADSGTLAASASCTIIITYTPTTSATDTGTITVNYNDGTGAQSATRGVTGVGLSAITQLWSTDNAVWAMALVGSTLYIGGDFTKLMATTMGGSLIDTSLGYPVAGTWKLANQINGTLYSTVSDGSGGFYIGGAFTAIGASTRNYAAHILSDGSLDSSWNPNCDGIVYTMIYDSTNHVVYMGGSFTTAGGAGRNYVAAVNDTTGAVTTWDPSTDWLDGTVRTMVLNGTTLYIGGDFTLAGGATPLNNLAAYSTATGALTAWQPAPGGGTTSARAMILDSTGTKMLVGFGGGNYAGCYLLSNGTSCAWDPQVNAPIYAIARSGTTVYIGGNFSAVNGATPRLKLAAVDEGTSLATAFDANLNGDVNALDISGTTLYVGGAFTTVGGASHAGVVALDKSTAAPIASSTYYAAYINSFAWVYTIAHSGTKIYVGGSLTHVGNTTMDRSYLAAIDTTTGIPTSWNPQPDGSVISMVYDGSSKLYVGGPFGNMGATARGSLASFNTSNGALNSWDPNANNNVFIHSLYVDGSTVYIGGGQTNINGGVTAHPYFTAVDTTNGTEVVASNFVPNNGLFSIDVDSTYIYMGGTFNNGKDLGALARINKTTKNHDATWPAAAMRFDDVRSLRVSGSNLIASGVLHSTGTYKVDAIQSGGTSAWEHAPDNYIYKILLSGSTLYYTGQFSNWDGGPGYGTAYFTATDTSGTWTTNTPSPGSLGYDIIVSGGKIILGGQSTYVYSAGLSQPGGNFSGLCVIDATTGNPL